MTIEPPAVIKTLKKCCSVLLDQQIVVCTDHKNLTQETFKMQSAQCVLVANSIGV